jgi:hypothetical protein
VLISGEAKFLGLPPDSHIKEGSKARAINHLSAISWA